ncbi:16S rRNA (cytidine(1402)-2'-O)-methyltransferase [Bacillus sp. CGMCC 1.16541]|uniref:16S rRNA (cytidine(1402)-2'-O)-methyltransferase n=1 Tax=Bacillus sp. CGMCC 1.16541 TaxID=2185143 RepID=UPI000D72B677|nr:16S rRNA (cytidine(1402)-2'-O)-methyltransferase [Bacillus sp. CGMCC 1.16541]
MKQQKSYSGEQEGGTLYLVPTPIGNLEDMTFRAIRILKEVDYIAAEDTRQTKKLCNHFEVSTPIKSYHEHNKESKGQQMVADLKSGQSIALVSDAGMPCISDPGYELVALAVQENQVIVPLPGANAALTALMASGLPTDHFYFYGFLHRQKKQKIEQLQDLMYRKETMIFYEAPHRLKETLKLMNDVWGDRYIVLSRELTKRYEEFLRGSISDALDWASTEEVRGEFCVIVEGSQEEEVVPTKWWEDKTIIEHVDYYINEKAYSSKEAIKQVAVEREMPKRDVYNTYHIK